eukprot:SAG22_NODE_16478_length_324_cov_0.915556_1_plen_46_part_10
MKNADAAIQSQEQAKQFVAAMHEFSDPAEMLLRFADPKQHGAKRLR